MGNARLGRSNWEIFLCSSNVYMQINGYADVAAVQFVWEVLRKQNKFRRAGLSKALG